MLSRISILLLPLFFGLTNLQNHSIQTHIAVNKYDTVREPKMKLEETTVPDMIVLTIRDTAKTTNDIGPRLGADYGEIGAFMNKTGIAMANAPMAWYHTIGEPFIFSAGVAVNKEPAEKPTGRIELTKIPGGKAIVVRFWGPYELTAKAYLLITDWLKKNNKQADGAPYDIYVSDPSGKDPYDVQTDIYQKIR